MVLDQAVRPPRPFGQRVHGRLHDAGDGQVVRVGSLPPLEEHVGVLGRSTNIGSVWAHPPAAHLNEGIVIDKGRHVLRCEDRNLGELVRCPETVEEV